MFTLQDIKKIKSDMETESLIACSDEFIERLTNLQDKRNDDVAKAMLPHRTNYNSHINNIPPGYDSEGNYL